MRFLFLLLFSSGYFSSVEASSNAQVDDILAVMGMTREGTYLTTTRIIQAYKNLGLDASEGNEALIRKIGLPMVKGFLEEQTKRRQLEAALKTSLGNQASSDMPNANTPNSASK